MKRIFLLLLALLMVGCVVVPAERGRVVVPSSPPAIVLPAPPTLVIIPGTDIYYVPGVEVNLYFYGGYYYYLYEGHWHYSRDHRGPWAFLPPDRVPPGLQRIPPGYYKKVPPGQLKKGGPRP